MDLSAEDEISKSNRTRLSLIVVSSRSRLLLRLPDLPQSGYYHLVPRLRQPRQSNEVCGSRTKKSSSFSRGSFSRTNCDSVTYQRYCLIAINHAATIGPCGPRPRPPFAGGSA